MKADIWIPVLKAGKDAEAVGLDKAKIDTMIANYDPVNKLKAPVTFDHDQWGPAYGWVDAIQWGDQDGKNKNWLYAHLDWFDPEAKRLMQERKYATISIEYYPAYRDSEEPYFGALSLLGATPPQIQGQGDLLRYLSQGEQAGQKLYLDAKVNTEDISRLLASDEIISLSQNEGGTEDMEKTKDLEANVEKLQKAESELKAQLQAVQSENEQLKKQLSVTEEQSKEVTDASKAILKEIEDNKQKLAQAQKEIKALQEQNKLVKKESIIKEKVSELKSKGLLNAKFLNNGGYEALLKADDVEPVATYKDEAGVEHSKTMFQMMLESSLTLSSPIKLESEVESKQQVQREKFSLKANEKIDADRLALHEKVLAEAEKSQCSYEQALQKVLQGC